MNFVLYFIAGWSLAFASARFVPGKLARTFTAILLCIAYGATLILGASALEPWQRLALTTGGLLYLIKCLILLKNDVKELSTCSSVGLLIYSTIWPGMELAPFRNRKKVEEDGTRFVRGFLSVAFGFAILVALILFGGTLPPYLVGWLTLIALLAMIHFGYAEILTSVLRIAGWDVSPLFDHPFLSTSLREFWSVRWNHAFVEMNKVLFIPFLKKWLHGSALILGVFLLSGLLHELAISYASQALVIPSQGPIAWSWGLPTLYFAIQGVGFLLERSLLSDVKSPVVRSIWTLCWVLLPMPLVFTDLFRSLFLIPMVDSLRILAFQHDLRWWFSLALWCAAVGNFVTMTAGAQVPFRLNWEEELAKLSKFNRKIFLNYYGYVGLSVLTWGLLTIFLHDEFLNGDKTALFVSSFMGTFWGLRVLVDFFYFHQDDWPAGPEMVIGHTCLTALFCALTSTYFGVVLWHVLPIVAGVR
jgi:hypothetical protein